MILGYHSHSGGAHTFWLIYGLARAAHWATHGGLFWLIGSAVLVYGWRWFRGRRASYPRPSRFRRSGRR